MDDIWKDSKDFKHKVINAILITSQESIDEALEELNILLNNPQDCGTPYEVVETIYQRLEEISINTMNMTTIAKYYGHV